MSNRATPIEIGYLSGVTSAIQTQLNGKGAATNFASVLAFNATGTPTTTSTSFADIAGMVNQTVSVPATGNYLITLESFTFTSSLAGSADYVLQLVVDSAGTPQNLPYPQSEVDSSNESLSQTLLVTLSAGSHTFKPQWKRVSGSVTLQTDAAYGWALVIRGVY